MQPGGRGQAGQMEAPTGTGFGGPLCVGLALMLERGTEGAPPPWSTHWFPCADIH